MPAETWDLPAIPDEPVEEGSRWRHHKPSSAAVAQWFATQPLDEDMKHADYIGGVVLIPQNEKVKYTSPDGRQERERHERVYTPYVQIGTRVGYFRRLAQQRDLISVIEPADDIYVAKNPNSPYFNGNMEKGLWWHVVTDAAQNVYRYLCATAVVALYEKQSFADKYHGRPSVPLLQGRGTKQVAAKPDDANMIAKAQTGAIGRALGVAGVLVIGTGIATAEDMMELPGYGASDSTPTPQLPPAGAPPSEVPEGLAPAGADDRESLLATAEALKTRLQEAGKWPPVAAWYAERAKAEGWANLAAAPLEGVRSVISYMERALHAGEA